MEKTERKKWGKHSSYISFRLPEEEKDIIDQKALEYGVSSAKLLRYAVRKALLSNRGKVKKDDLLRID